ncbi:MAG: ABC transporter ATP-binding protein/permease [Flavobacteriales bacterium]|nr:ABC transporter ATP-binding protein/permease [Flavobacteriales bacterium]
MKKENSPKKTSLFNKLYGFTKPHKTYFLSALLTVVLISVIAPTRPYLIQYTFDRYILSPDPVMLQNMIILMIGLLLIETIIQFGVTYLSNRLGQLIILDIRKQVFGKISSFKLKYFDNTPVGTLVTRVVSDIETIASVFSEGFLQIMGDLLKIFAAIGFMLWIDWKLTLVTLIPIPLLIIATNAFKNGIKKSFKEVRNRVAELNAFLQEHITGMSIVQIFNRENQEFKKFEEINEEHKKAHIRSIWYYSIFFPIVEIITAFSIGLAIWYGATDVMKSTSPEASPGKIISFILYVYMLYRPMRQLADRFNTMQMGIVASERVFHLLDSDETIPDNGHIMLDNLKGRIEFKNVWFAYHGDEFVLKGIHLNIEPGEKIAIVGTTGSGKTSIINVLSRSYEFSEGDISLDGVSIRDIRSDSLAENISVVLQDVFLFSGSILENIRLQNEQIRREEIIEASKFIGTHAFIEKLPGGYDFDVKERGNMLSAGQRQLLAFLRAYVHKPKILILDEATSSVDTESEQLIQKATEIISQNRTSIIIAHRLSTVRNANRILVMESGKIIESGSHDELMSFDSNYKKLIEKQYALS